MRKGSWLRRLLGPLCVTCLVVGATGGAQAAVGGGGSGGTTFTTSTTRHDTHTRVDIADAHRYQTRVLGYVYETGYGSATAYVYDQTTPHSPSSNEVQTLFNQAHNAVATQADNATPGRTASLTIGAPHVVAGSVYTTTSAAVKVGEQFNRTETSVTSTTSLGPGTIMIGEDQSQSFFVAAGTTNINTNTHTETFIDDLFQKTQTHHATYQVDGNKYVSPLILDLSGSGRIQASGGLYRPHPSQFNIKYRKLFDFYGNGFPVAMEWVGPEDGLLCVPKADGSVDGTCLFGTATGYQTGFEQLASLDVNMDFKVNGKEMAGLMVWQDKNQNARAEQAELSSLQDLGITELSVKNSQDVGSYVRNNTTYKMFDWWPTVLTVKKVKLNKSV